MRTSGDDILMPNDGNWKDGAPDPELEVPGTDPGSGEFWQDGHPNPNLDVPGSIGGSMSVTFAGPALAMSGTVSLPNITGNGMWLGSGSCGSAMWID